MSNRAPQPRSRVTICRRQQSGLDRGRTCASRDAQSQTRVSRLHDDGPRHGRYNGQLGLAGRSASCVVRFGGVAEAGEASGTRETRSEWPYAWLCGLWRWQDGGHDWPFSACVGVSTSTSLRMREVRLLEIRQTHKPNNNVSPSEPGPEPPLAEKRHGARAAVPSSRKVRQKGGAAVA